MSFLNKAKEYYLTYGKPMIEEKFAEYIDEIAIGVVGSGSEMYGFEDEFSEDHDYSLGFMMFLTNDTYEKIGFKLLREYLSLPHKEISTKNSNTSRYMSNKFGVFEISEFYMSKIGTYGDLSLNDFLNIPTFYFAEATSGEVFVDNLGEFTKYRNYLQNIPRDVFFQKLGRYLVLSGQAGQYNYNRQIKRENGLSSKLCLNEYINQTLSLLYVINNRFELFYKWKVDGLNGIEILPNVLKKVKNLLNYDYSREKVTQVIEDNSTEIIKYLIENNFSTKDSLNLEDHAFMVHNKIEDRTFKLHHILD